MQGLLVSSNLYLDPAPKEFHSTLMISYFFVKPCEEEMVMATAMLNKFGEALGLITNLNKSCVIPI
jgi:hypothetical protein